MSRLIWGTCCALLAVVLLSSSEWLPAEADGADMFEESEDAPTTSSISYPEAPRLAEIAAKRRINKILDTPLKAPLDYFDTPLNEIINILQEDYDIPIFIDTVRLDLIAISPETEVTINLRNITLRAALELMLGQIEDLTYVPRDQVLMITTQDAAAETLEVHVYRVDDILDARENFNGTDGRENFDGLIEVIVSSVERDSWLENDTGEGEIHPLQPGMLVITQTFQMHQQIARLLTDIRETRRQMGASKDRSAALLQPITRGFKIDVEMGENPDVVKDQITESVMQSIDWNMANSELAEKQIWLKVLPDRLLVRHLPSVVHQVERVVADMKLAK